MSLIQPVGSQCFVGREKRVTGQAPRSFGWCLAHGPWFAGEVHSSIGEIFELGAGISADRASGVAQWVSTSVTPSVFLPLIIHKENSDLVGGKLALYFIYCLLIYFTFQGMLLKLRSDILAFLYSLRKFVESSCWKALWQNDVKSVRAPGNYC